MGVALWITVARHVGIAVGLTAVAAVLIAWLLWRLFRGVDRRTGIAALSLALVITVCAGTLGTLCLQAMDGYEDALAAAYEADLDEAVANHPQKMRPAARRRLMEEHPRNEYLRQLRQDWPLQTYVRQALPQYWQDDGLRAATWKDGAAGLLLGGLTVVLLCWPRKKEGNEA